MEKKKIYIYIYIHSAVYNSSIPVRTRLCTPTRTYTPAPLPAPPPAPPPPSPPPGPFPPSKTPPKSSQKAFQQQHRENIFRSKHFSNDLIVLRYLCYLMIFVL